MPFDFKKFEEKVATSKEWLRREYSGIRTGRASPSVLDGISVQAYGSVMPLKQVAGISIEDPRTLRVQPYDAGLLKDIERAISSADLGLGTGTDASGVRVSFPDLTSERRQEMIKIAKQKLEETKAILRVARDEAWKDIQTQEREGTLTEDDKYSLKDELQKIMDNATEDMEGSFEAKQKEMQS
jgi:ribosome recycling factor